MNVAHRFDSEQCSELEFAPSALYLLAATSTPEAARKEALVRAGAGEKISWVKAKEIKQKYAKSAKKVKDKKLKTSDKQLPENSLVIDRKEFSLPSTSQMRFDASKPSFSFYPTAKTRECEQECFPLTPTPIRNLGAPTPIGINYCLS